jgi:hypothetical protein
MPIGKPGISRKLQRLCKAEINVTDNGIYFGMLESL